VNAPAVDYHQHLFSPAAGALVTGNPSSPGIAARDVIALLDSAYGSDAAASPLAYPRAGWAAFQRLPLSDAEFRIIANNVAPYMRDLALRKIEAP